MNSSRALRLRAQGSCLAVEGQLDYFTRQQLDEELLTLCGTDHPQLRLDLAGVDFIDSTAARHVINAVARLTREGRQLTVVGARGQVRKMLCILGLECLLEDLG